ncbi:hypothetical protein [Nocardia sp. NPDC049149]|uniref:hypothetical protein n=1 Tax=Nocardia sp. NPDC049149 TaxID=3364315 RepID=UPI00371499BB
MAINRSIEFGSGAPLRGHQKAARRCSYLAAGVLAVSAVGYGMVDAPVSIADNGEARTVCTGGKGTITISEEDGAFYGDAEQTTPLEKGADFKEGDTCPADAVGRSQEISVKKDENSCVYTAKPASGKDSGDAKIKPGAGYVTVVLPMSGGKGTLYAVAEQAGAESENEAEAIVTGTVPGGRGKVTECKLEAAAVFKVTDITVTKAAKKSNDSNSSTGRGE